MKSHLIIAGKFLIVMTILTGIIYPLLMTGIAQILFPFKANGSLIIKNGKIIGSELIGQKFDSTLYFWSRPSFIDYNAVPSGASNYGPSSGILKKQVMARRNLFIKFNSVCDSISLPKEMIFASGSGLDPHISPEAAILQTDRIIKARNFDTYDKEKLLKEIEDLTEKPQYFFLGEERINVLLLNLRLDKIEINKNMNK